MAFEDDKELHLSPFLVCDFGPTRNCVLFIYVLYVLLNELEVLIIFLLPHDIQPFLELFEQKVTQKNLNSLNVNVRNVREIFALGS
jgi:hypothetical protein